MSSSVCNVGELCDPETFCAQTKVYKKNTLDIFDFRYTIRNNKWKNSQKFLDYALCGAGVSVDQY